MSHSLSSLQPAALWSYFYELTQIPRPSHHTEKVRAYLVNFAAKHQLDCKVDDAGNVLIIRPTAAEFASKPAIALQCHMDMVPQKNESVAHNFETDSIQPRIQDAWVYATQTTLGADNGIGMAAALAVLASDYSLPCIEALFTNDEETGMHGVFGLKKGFLSAATLLNLDSEDEGELFVGCAGGIDADFTFSYSPTEVPTTYKAFELKVSGLKGGHSGIDIALERANANKLLFQLLLALHTRCAVRLNSVNGGSLRNAIPRESTAIIAVSEAHISELIKIVAEFETQAIAKYAGIESTISVKIQPYQQLTQVLPDDVALRLIKAMVAAHNGVYRHIPEMPSVVESSANLAVIRTENKQVQIRCLLRSASEQMRNELCTHYQSFFELAGAKVEFLDGYPGWKPNFSSPVLAKMKEIYLEKFGKEPEIKVIHAGLECGIIGALEPDIDMISFGPTIRYPHSPDERVEIASVAKFWDLLILTLQKM